VVTRIGDLTAHVQRLVEEEYKPEPELAPVPHHLTEERTAAAWDPLRLPEIATLTHAQVSLTADSENHAFKTLKASYTRFS